MSKDPQRGAPDAGTLAFTFVGMVLVFTGIGFGLDHWLHTGPWLMVAGVFVGAALGFTYMVFILFTTSSGGRRRGKNSGGQGTDERSS